MAKYKYAIYYDLDNEKQIIYPNDLHDVTKLAFARDQELYDSDEQIRLYPRYRKDTPHFYALQDSKRKITQRNENSEEHNLRVNKLLDTLNSSLNDTLKVGYFTFGEDKKQQFNTLTKIKNYTWGKEINRFISESSICRHDIYGQKNVLSQSSIFPAFAIEVIDTHYPTDDVINGWIELSKIMPIVIAFDLIKKPNYYFQIKDNKIRIIYYIFDGSIWKNEKRQIDLVSAGAFRETLSRE